MKVKAFLFWINFLFSKRSYSNIIKCHIIRIYSENNNLQNSVYRTNLHTVNNYGRSTKNNFMRKIIIFKRFN